MTYAQFGDDDWIVEQFPPDFIGYAADVGAYDGVTRSNTLLLEARRWTVLCIEPNPMVARALKKNRAFVQDVACDAKPQDRAKLWIHENNPEAHTALRPVTTHPVWHPDKGATFTPVMVAVETLDHCLERAEFPRLDALSIDTEGTELQVLQGLDLMKWKPHVIVAESWDEDTPITPYLSEFGYRRVRRAVVNNCYRRETT